MLLALDSVATDSSPLPPLVVAAVACPCPPVVMTLTSPATLDAELPDSVVDVSSPFLPAVLLPPLLILLLVKAAYGTKTQCQVVRDETLVQRPNRLLYLPVNRPLNKLISLHLA